jgi:hypothetical protein
MKTKITSLILFAFGIVTVLAQTNTFNPATTPLPSDVAGYWKFLIAGVTPLIVWLARTLVPKIPTVFLPTITPFIGVLLGWIINQATKSNLSWVDAAQLGLLGVGIREILNQAVTKRLKKIDSQ